MGVLIGSLCLFLLGPALYARLVQPAAANAGAGGEVAFPAPKKVITD